MNAVAEVQRVESLEEQFARMMAQVREEARVQLARASAKKRLSR